MSQAKYCQETRDFLENVFKLNNYTLEQEITYLEHAERRKWHYQCDCPQVCDKDFINSWNEIIEMLKERTAKA